MVSLSHSEHLPSVRAWVVLVCIEAILAGLLWMIGLITPALLIMLGLLGLLGMWLWDRRAYLRLTLTVLVCLLVIGVAGYLKWTTPVPMTAPSLKGPPNVKAFWLADSEVGGNIFFRMLVCGDSDLEIEAKHVVLPYGASDAVDPIDTTYEQKLECKIVYASSRPLSRIGRPTILGVVYRRRGQGGTQATSIFFFDPNAATFGQSMQPIQRQDLKGDRLADLKAREMNLQMLYPANVIKQTLPEMYAGKPVEAGFGDNNKAFLFQPLTKTVAFCANQRGVLRSRSVELDPAHASGHDVVISYDDNKSTIGLSVDGVVAGENGGFRDELCKRSIRPAP